MSTVMKSSRDIIVQGYFPEDAKRGARDRRDAPNTRYEQGVGGENASKQPIRVSGVKGMKSTPFTKKFPNMAAYERWADSEEAGNYEVHEVAKA